MQYPREDPGHERIATLDIEATAVDAREGELVSIGVGVHDRADPLTDATYETFHRQGDDEVAVVERAMEWLDGVGADALTTYNGSDYDLTFIRGRLDHHGVAVELPTLVTAERHIDLFVERKREADQTGTRWPSLEECLQSYGYTPPKTLWRDEPVTNTRFGEELGPAYLRTLGTETGMRLQDSLREAIDHYLVTDLEANFALFYADVGQEFDARYMGTERRFGSL